MKNIKDKNLMKKSIIKSAKSLWKSFPIILSTILLISLISTLIPKTFYTTIFTKNIFLDSFIGTLIGSIFAGNPITSYIFAGELLKQGIGLIAVTAFIVSWVTVGIVQLPAEATILGKKFALLRNLTAFIFAIVVAILTILILGVIK
jgi:uncharacterized membrane protein YraQ (UPF0718 family)